MNSYLVLKHVQCVIHFPASLNSEFVKKREDAPIVENFAEILVNQVSNNAVLIKHSAIHEKISALGQQMSLTHICYRCRTECSEIPVEDIFKKTSVKRTCS